MRNIKPFLAGLLVSGLMCTAAAPASAQAPQTASSADAGVPMPQLFPVKLVNIQRGNSGGLSQNPGARLTWQASVPGLSFCVAYASAHGVEVGPEFGHSFIGDRTHCLDSGRDGKVKDFVAFQVDDEDKSEDTLLIATIVLANNQTNTTAIPVDKLPPLKR